MYIDIVPNRNSPPAILLRESFRDGTKIKKRTIANLSSLTLEQAEAIRRTLKGEKQLAPETLFEVTASPAHGHVRAVLDTVHRLGLDKVISARRCRERDLVIAMVASRLLEPESKLALTRGWGSTTLGETLGVQDADEDELYDAMDWLLARQANIERQLAKRHLREGGRVLYDLSSSYFEGSTCPLAERGYNRDGKKGKLQVNYGLLTDDEGRPISITAFEGNTADPKTLLPQVEKVQGEFGVEHVVIVGDRGMISQKQIDELKQKPGVDWLTALKGGAIRQLVNNDALQLGLFDERQLFEFSHADFPGERLIACRNPELAKLRAHKRHSMLEATQEKLAAIEKMVSSGKLKGEDKIGVRVGRVVNQYNMAKHFVLDIANDGFTFTVDEQKVAQEAALDGIYVIRTSLEQPQASAEDAVRYYKDLNHVERAFRSMKSIDLEVRPIYHRLEQRVRAHLFLCMLSYYVKWHMMEAWRPLLFADEALARKAQRNPVAPATRSEAALDKVHRRVLNDGTSVHSFQSLMKNLATIVRNTCRRKQSDTGENTFVMETTPTKKQQRAYDLLKMIRV